MVSAAARDASDSLQGAQGAICIHYCSPQSLSLGSHRRPGQAGSARRQGVNDGDDADDSDNDIRWQLLVPMLMSPATSRAPVPAGPVPAT